MSARPFRHLCPEADLRDAMTDEEFWDHAARNLAAPTWDDDDAGPELDAAIDAPPCPECGEIGACGYDAEGRPLIHAVVDDDTA